MKTRKTSVNHGNSSSYCCCLLATVKSHTFHLLVCIAKWVCLRAFYYTKEDLSFLWDSKMPNAGPVEASSKGEQAEYFIVSV